MELRDAVLKAKAYVADLFDAEQATNYGLEEVRKNGDVWEVTVGFSRPWDVNFTGVGVLTGKTDLKREYKVVRIDDSWGRVLEMVNRKD